MSEPTLEALRTAKTTAEHGHLVATTPKPVGKVLGKALDAADVRCVIGANEEDAQRDRPVGNLVGYLIRSLERPVFPSVVRLTLAGGVGGHAACRPGAPSCPG